MPFVQRDASGSITGTFANAQSFASEFLADSDPSVIAFVNRPLPSPPSLTAQLAAELGTTPAQLKAALQKSAAAIPAV